MSYPITREGERRHVTVMFADISGFTAIARTMDPEDVTDLMNACFGILEKAVVEHGGHVDKYIGDCVMALFGAPNAVEDAPRQAINAAIAILARIADFAATRGIDGRIDAHVGINTGLVVYSDVGGLESRDTTAMGDTVNVASRLRDAAGTQSIYVGSQTHRETARDFRFRRVPGLRLKGIEGDYDGWEVLSRLPQRHRLRADERAGGLRLPMVGREDAMAAVEGALDRLDGGTGAVLAVTGEAGIGKSRLILEMQGLPRLATAVYAEGCALRLGGAALYPFVSLLRSWAGLDDEARGSTPASRARMVAAMEEVLGERTAEIYPFLATACALPLSETDSRRLDGIDAEGMHLLVARSLEELFSAVARRAPLVLVLEDLHWADRSTVDLLLRLLPIAARERILFVLALRTDGEPAATAILAALRDTLAAISVEVALRPLDAKAAAAMLRERIRFDDRPDRTRREILARTEGNPFFIEELIRSLVDVGAIQATPEGLMVTEHFSGVSVPGTIQELVMDRIDRLRPPVREVLQTASVVGRRFELPVLERVVPDEAAVAPAVEEQLRLELIEPLRGHGGTDFAFKHALAHETVYEAILRKRRRELHRRVGLCIEQIHGDRIRELYGALAYHFSTAEDWEKATHYLVKAGDEAIRSTASHEALDYFAEAGRILDELGGGRASVPSRASIEKKIGLACLGKGDLPAALDHLDRALAMLGHETPSGRAGTMRRLVADFVAILANLYLGVGRRRRRRPPERVVEISELLFHKGKAQSTTAPQGYVLSMLPAIRAVGAWDFRGIDHACGVWSAGAALFAWSGLSFRIARRMSAAGKAYIRTVPDAVIHATMLYVARYLEGDWSDAHALAKELVADGIRYGAFWEVNTYLGMQCERLIHQGRLAEAAAVIEEIAELDSAYGYRFARTNECAMRAFLLLQSRHLPRAREAAERYYEVCNEEALNLLALATRARIELLDGKRERAKATIEEAEVLARAIGRQAAAYHLSPLHLARFAYDLDTLETDGARSPALRRRTRASRDRSVAAASAIARDRPECYRLSARLAWICGKPRAAERWWRRALAEAERLGARPEIARICREAGERLRDAGRGGRRIGGFDAAQLLERAVAGEQELQRDWAPEPVQGWPA